MTPTRHQRSRARGARLPAGVKCVTRPSRWGNPFRPLNDTDEARQVCVQTYRAELVERMRQIPRGPWTRIDRILLWQACHLHELRGLDLACWCPLPREGEHDWCHAAVLMESANR